MEIKKPAVAGTMESSDCQVTVEPGNGKIEFTLDSAVAHQFGNQIRKVTLETLKNLGVDIIWLMPIHPIGKEKRKGTPS